MCRAWPKSPQPPLAASDSGSPSAHVRFIADQLLAKADVIRAMHGRVQLCQDLQTEFALLRESLGVSRINHILRVYGPHDPARSTSR